MSELDIYKLEQELELNKQESWHLSNLAYERQQKIEELENQLQQKENIIKEVREYIEKNTYDNPNTDFELEVNTVLGNALEILDKGE